MTICFVIYSQANSCFYIIMVMTLFMVCYLAMSWWISKIKCLNDLRNMITGEIQKRVRWSRWHVVLCVETYSKDSFRCIMLRILVLLFLMIWLPWIQLTIHTIYPVEGLNKQFSCKVLSGLDYVDVVKYVFYICKFFVRNWLVFLLSSL